MEQNNPGFSELKININLVKEKEVVNIYAADPGNVIDGRIIVEH